MIITRLMCIFIIFINVLFALAEKRLDKDFQFFFISGTQLTEWVNTFEDPH